MAVIAIRKAINSNVGDLACLTNLAGEGISEYLWGIMARPGETVMEVGIDGENVIGLT
ncbi:hypothetical protein [Hahella ganghwensis]|uniref:hypothetical protein n=1 Tax=Hahella ganghwensis TaxID=286420 RepID=UPI0003606067|nr:hypothetical protein [Hahella ganghwensis]